MVSSDIKPEEVSVPEGQEWRWCLVGNIVGSHPFGEEEETRNGTKHFGPGTKVYCAPGQWGDGYENIVVIGKPRRSRNYVCLVMPSKRIENFRIQKVFSPAILNIMAKDDWYWWDNTDKDRPLTSL